MAFVLSPPSELPPPLADRLAAVGRARRVARVVAGGFSFVALTLAVALAAGVLDAGVHLPAAARALCLAAVLATAGFAIVAKILPALRDRATSHRTALLLESGYGGLNDALASAVEFSATPGNGSSERFRQIAVKRAENLLSRIEPSGVVPSGAAWASFWVAASLVVVTAFLVALNPSRAGLAAVRLADPFGFHPWPAKTVLEIVEPSPLPYRMAKGDGLTIRVTVTGVVPELAVLSLRLSDGPVLTEPVPLKKDGESDRFANVSLPLDASRIPRDFEFRLTANDADTGWRAVAVAPPPRLVPWGERPSPQVSVAPPAYSGLPATTLPDGTGVIEGVAGTRVTFAAKADRRIVAAVLVPLSDPSAVPVAAPFAPFATWQNPLLAPAATPLALTLAEPIPIHIGGPDLTELTATFVPRWPGLHALRLTDETGLTGVRLFDIRVYPDPAPHVSLDRPAAGKESLVLLPTARVTLETRADDRTFGLRSVWLDYRVRDGAYRSFPLADYAALSRTFPALAGAAWATGSISSPAASLAGSLPLSRFVKADGTPPADGDTVTLRTAADDWDDVSVAKTPGRSVEVTIRVVSASTLDAVLQASLAELRPALRESLEREKEAQRLTAEALKKAEEAKGWTPEARDALARAEQLQRDAKARLADPRDGLRQKAEDAQRTAKANGLPSTGTAAQVDAAARTLGRIADEHLDTAEAALAAARQSAERASGNPAEKANATEAANAARKQQEAVASGVTGLLDRLARWGGAGEVRADAQTLKDKVAAAGDQLRAGDTSPDGTKIAEEFQKFADDANGLLQKAEAIAAEKEKQGLAEGPAGERAKAEAEALRAAVEQSGGAQLTDALRAAGAAAKAGRNGEADAARAAASERLGKMTEALTERKNEPTGDELKKNRKEDADTLEKLAVEHDELRKKAKDAERIEDPAERTEELKRLADKQEKLQKEAELLAEKLTRDRAEKTAETVKRAAEQMAAAAAEQRQGRPANEERDDAAQKLQDARKEFKQETRESDEQLEREEREKLLARVKSLRDRQAAAVAESKRLLTEAVKAKQWDRPLLASLADLATAEAAIAGELRPFAETQLESLPVFAKVASGAAEAGEKARLRIEERKDELLTADAGAAFDAETEALAHDRMTRPMALALKRLDVLLDAVKPDSPKPGTNGEPKGPGEGGMGGEGGEGGQQKGPGESIPALAQLKALRGLQADLNERTVEFQKANPDPSKYDDDLRTELKDLERDQRDIAELFEKLASQLRPMPEDP